MKFFTLRNYVLLSFILIAALTRLVPHPPNVAPITAMALFAGATFHKQYLAFLIPLMSMFISDIFLGFYSITPFVYLSFIGISFIGVYCKNIKPGTILMGSTLFFIISNLGVWLLSYPLTIEGLLTCFTLAIPFFINSLIGDFGYSALLYFGFKALEKKWNLA